ncbi:hypothetical protein [Streptomyces sparsogenes]|uniref:Uncharacterized protein n=1 Tax=Streptomyces sparsogenes DSM 40356 TaxID=1331668 RepID=A0A1R1S6L9_9ACTN|nr:hypothetical protein [Streptomyces sparsogenes]OMI33946.1 hypothetical protein SPAR_39059 [Streptomyces sparsogenes DSM 40356]
MTGLDGATTNAERAAAELRSALALAGIEPLSIGWSAVGGASSRGLVHISGIRPEAARALADAVRRGTHTRRARTVLLPQATAEDVRAALDPLWFRPCRCEERTGIPCPEKSEKRERPRLRGSTTSGP